MTARPVITNPTALELHAFKICVSYGTYSSQAHTSNLTRMQYYRAKNKLGLANEGPQDCLAWVLLNHPDWVIEESPIGRALSGLLKLASLGKNVQEYMNANSR